MNKNICKTIQIVIIVYIVIKFYTLNSNITEKESLTKTPTKSFTSTPNQKLSILLIEFFNDLENKNLKGGYISIDGKQDKIFKLSINYIVNFVFFNPNQDNKEVIKNELIQLENIENNFNIKLLIKNYDGKLNKLNNMIMIMTKFHKDNSSNQYDTNNNIIDEINKIKSMDINHQIYNTDKISTYIKNINEISDSMQLLDYISIENDDIQNCFYYIMYRLYNIEQY